jgi:hypothetical protein
MTDAGVAIIFLAFGVGALLVAAIPGLSFGLAIGMFVKRKRLQLNGLLFGECNRYFDNLWVVDQTAKCIRSNHRHRHPRRFADYDIHWCVARSKARETQPLIWLFISVARQFIRIGQSRRSALRYLRLIQPGLSAG